MMKKQISVFSRAFWLARGSRVLGTTDSTQALRLFGEVRPDLVVLDVRMPSLDGSKCSGNCRVSYRRPIFFPFWRSRATPRRRHASASSAPAKFTQEGHVWVAVHTDEDGKPLRLDVIDTGVGVPVDRLEAIFQMFEQADNSTQRGFGGTGLGLAISRTLCELMGYRLTAISEVGVGSAFSVLFDSACPAPSSYAELASACAETMPVCA